MLIVNNECRRIEFVIIFYFVSVCLKQYCIVHVQNLITNPIWKKNKIKLMHVFPSQCITALEALQVLDVFESKSCVYMLDFLNHIFHEIDL